MGKRVTVGFQDDELRPREVRLIDVDGTQIGIVPIRDALQMARDRGLRLFIAEPESNPPVARILDYEQHKLELSARNRETKKKHRIQYIREIKLQLGMESAELDSKIQEGKQYLVAGERVKVLMVLRGREMQFKDEALSKMRNFARALTDTGTAVKEPELEGKSILMLLDPGQHSHD